MNYKDYGIGEREIKFRAWLTSYGDPFMDHDPLIFTKDHGNELYINDGIDELLDVLMQYTGIKDKNGKEIYEGDILEGSFWNGHNYEDEVGVVVFKDGYFSIKGRLLSDCIEDGEIIACIGNIFENQELAPKK